MSKASERETHFKNALSNYVGVLNDDWAARLQARFK